MADVFKALRRSFTVEQVQYIVDLRFGQPANFVHPLRSFGLIFKLTGLQPATTWKLCKRFLHAGQIVLGRATSAVSSRLTKRERDFLLDLQELRNFSIEKRLALFAAMFGKKLTTWNLRKFYKENRVRYSRPTRLFNRAITNEVALNVLRVSFKSFLLGLLVDASSRIFYLDETSFNAQEQPNKCWQHIDEPLKFAIPIRRPHNVTLFGAVGNQAPKPIFYLAASTNQHDVVVFLKQLRAQINSAAMLQSKLTYLVLDNHTAHKAHSVRNYITEDERMTSHRFVLVFQPPYSSYYNSQETVWAHVKRRFRQIMATVVDDVSQERFSELVWQSCHDCNFINNNLFNANLK